MSIKKKTFSYLIVVVLLAASFFAGSYVKEQERNHDRSQRCCTLVSFEIDKAENENLADQGTMKALISNVYAAYELCDDVTLADQLHDLWNYLIFEGENDIDTSKKIILNELNAVLRSIKRVK